MTILLLGLLLFLGVHSIRMVAPAGRDRAVARLGLLPWKAMYALLSLAGLILIIVGFGMARQAPLLAWLPPPGLRHLNALLVLVAFVLVAAAYVPRNHFRAWLGHPMLAGTALWALGHLLVTRFWQDALLFGAFLAWALACYAGARRRDRLAGTPRPAAGLAGDVLAIAVGIVAWAAFAFWLHLPLIGVRPAA